jgi:adenylate cyclase
LDLLDLRRRAPPTSRVYLAVLPFTNLSSDPENAYWAQGLKEELIRVLTNVESLRVIEVPKAERVAQLGGKLSVRAVLSGSVRKSGDRLRITVNLIDPGDEQRLWAAAYDRDFKDVFMVEDEIAREIVRTLQVRLAGNQNQTLVRDHAVNLEAYSLYLKGRWVLNMWGIERAEMAIRYFEQAIAKDSGYALAYTGLADSYDILGDMEVWPATEAFERSRQAVYKALELDPGLPEAIAARGSLAVESWDWPAFERDLRQAIQLKPNYQPAHRWLGAVLASLGRREEALAELKRAWELNPIAPSTNLTMARTDYWYGRSNDAMRQSQKTLELAPDWPSVHLLMGLIYEQRGEPAPALTEVTKAAELSARAPGELSFLGHAYAIYGRRTEAQEILRDLIAKSREEYVAPLNIARIYAGLGDRDRACEWLEKAYQKGAIHWPFWLVDPMWDSLRSEPRFVAVVNKVGLKRY